MSPSCVRCSGRYGLDAGRSFRRGLCDPCWWQVFNYEDIEDFPKKNRSSWEVIEDYSFIKANQGGQLKDIADRMGMKPKTLEQALGRARKRGVEVP